MSNKAKRHTHKYYRANMSYVKVWACALPDCSHYTPPHMEELVNGKASICWQCGEKFVLTGVNMKQDKPICTECSLGLGPAPGIFEKEEIQDESTPNAILDFIHSKG